MRYSFSLSRVTHKFHGGTIFSIDYVNIDAHLRRKTLIPWWALDRPPDRAFEARTALELARIHVNLCIFKEIQIRRHYLDYPCVFNGIRIC